MKELTTFWSGRRRPLAGFDFQVKRQAMEWLLVRYFDRLIANGQQTFAL